MLNMSVVYLHKMWHLMDILVLCTSSDSLSPPKTICLCDCHCSQPCQMPPLWAVHNVSPWTASVLGRINRKQLQLQLDVADDEEEDGEEG